MSKDWWHNAVVYHIYPLSFQDSDGDGSGDINGIRQRLPYLQRLGIDVIWICPIFRSPMADNGYDISDYYQVDSRFGTNEELLLLIQEAKACSIHVLLDLVVNHCSDQHTWFQKAVHYPQSEEAGYFYFRQTDDEEPPCNWRSNFGGPTWTRLVDGRWYYHTFSPQQPDLNWENPRLREKLYQMIRWWLQKGIAGFRIDAITFIKKELSFASRPMKDGDLYPVENFENYQGIGNFLTEMKQQCFDSYNALTVAEAPGVTSADFNRYCGKNGYFSMIFDFDWINMMGETDKSDAFAIERWKQRIFNSQLPKSRSGWSALCLENHDQPRCGDRFLEKRDQSYKSLSALALLYFFMKGTPFIFQGQELGMTNAPWNDISEFQDVSARTLWQEGLEAGHSREELLDYLQLYGRDNSRTPFQWNSGKYAGFSTSQPWLNVNPNYQTVNAEAQINQDDSLWSFYHQLIMLRKSDSYGELFAYGAFQPVFQHKTGLIAYLRSYREQTVIIAVNFIHQTNQIPVHIEKLLISNDQSLQTDNGLITLSPYQAFAAVVQATGTIQEK